MLRWPREIPSGQEISRDVQLTRVRGLHALALHASPSPERSHGPRENWGASKELRLCRYGSSNKGGQQCLDAKQILQSIWYDMIILDGKKQKED